MKTVTFRLAATDFTGDTLSIERVISGAQLDAAIQAKKQTREKLHANLDELLDRLFVRLEGQEPPQKFTAAHIGYRCELTEEWDKRFGGAGIYTITSLQKNGGIYVTSRQTGCWLTAKDIIRIY